METLVLDPIEVAIRRTQIDITQYVAGDGPDWGEAAIEQYLADVQLGQIPVDYRLPNRTVTIPLLMRGVTSGMTFEQLRTQLQQKVAMLQREGGWIKRQTSLGTLYADVVGAQLKFGGSTAQALWGIDADAVMTLTTLPDWYGDEIETAPVSNSSDASELVYTLSVKGDLPARARWAIQNLSTIDIHGLLWGVRTRNYASDTTSWLSMEAQYMTPVAPAAVVNNATAQGGKEAKITALSQSWTAVLATDLPADGGALKHVGSYRVWAKVRTEVDPLYPATLTAPRVRLVWDVGDLMQPVENPPVQMPLDADWWMADLGEIRLDRSPIGNHRWQGMIQAMGSKGFAVNKVWFQPLDEASGRLAVVPNAGVGLTGYSARDPFEGATTGPVTAQPLSVGGNWTFSHGDTDDFTYDGANFRVKRSTLSDTASRFIYASGPTLTATAVQIDFSYPVATIGPAGGVLQSHLMFRRVDASNYGYVSVGQYDGLNSGSWRVYLGVVVAGTPITLAMALLPSLGSALWSLRVVVTTSGYIFAWLFPQGSPVPTDPVVLRYDPTRFATGSPLAAGKVGFGDGNSGTSVIDRVYDNFLAWVPDADAVIFGGKGAELRFDGMYREGPTGSQNYSKVGTVLGDLLRLPSAGIEGRTTEVFLRPSFGDFEQGSDSQLLRLQAIMRYRPCYLFVPEG